MTAQEAILNLLTAKARIPDEYFLYLAAHAHELRLGNGAPLNDATDFKAILIELAEAFSVATGNFTSFKQARALAAVPPQKRWDKTCPRCGHIHQELRECGAKLGGERVCLCDMEASA